MSKQELHELWQGMYASYVNITRKNGREPIPFKAFRSRMAIWREW
jgi:hypothetical protein